MVNLALGIVCGTVEFEAKGYMYRENYPLRPCYDRVRHMPRSMIANQSISPSQQLQNPVQLPLYIKPHGLYQCKSQGLHVNRVQRPHAACGTIRVRPRFWTLHEHPDQIILWMIQPSSRPIHQHAKERVASSPDRLSLGLSACHRPRYLLLKQFGMTRHRGLEDCKSSKAFGQSTLKMDVQFIYTHNLASH